MTCQLTEEDLWSGLDRNAPDITAHLAECPECRERAALIESSIRVVRQSAGSAEPQLPERIGSYAIKRRLGAGGMGIVYEGEQASPKRLVAVKVVRGGPFVDEYRLRLFEREAQTLARLRHPAIASIYEAGRTAEGQPYFAMELVTGLSLIEYACQHDLDLAQRLTLFQRVCGAIHYAHQRGVIHRDLKPTNILIDPDGAPKILDFGLARITDGDAVSTTQTLDAMRLMGTLPYMSPEEARGSLADVDVRSDVYSLGVILFELLTGTLPFQLSRSALPEAVRVICEEQPVLPSSINPELHGDPDSIILKAMEKGAARRYQSPEALSEDIGRFLADQPVLARRAGFLYKSRKLILRHRFACIIASAVTLILIAAALWVNESEQEFQDLQTFNAFLQDQRAALLELELAEARRELGDFAKAEQYYKSAISALERTDREDKVAEAMLGLAELLIQRGSPLDFEDAEVWLRKGLQFYDQDPGRYAEERMRVLKGLCTLYGPDVWDLPGPLQAIEMELESITNAARSSEDSGQEAKPAG